jgi:hypothetical protein
VIIFGLKSPSEPPPVKSLCSHACLTRHEVFSHLVEKKGHGQCEYLVLRFDIFFIVSEYWALIRGFDVFFVVFFLFCGIRYKIVLVLVMDLKKKNKNKA